MILIFQALIQKHDAETEVTFLEQVIKVIDKQASNDTKEALLAQHVLDSIAGFYKIVAKDSSRNGLVAKKILLQAVTGTLDQDCFQTYLLSEKLGARRQTLYSEFENRKILEKQQLLIPFIQMLRRKSPSGSKFVSEQTRYEIIAFYEDEEVSDILKGHNNIYKEKIMSENGDVSYFIRSKRVLKVHFCDLLKSAQKQACYQFSLSTLMHLRPPWVLLSRDAHTLTCLCDRCQNLVLLLRSVCHFVNWIRKYGSPADKVPILKVDISPSLTDFISKVMHPKPEGNVWHQSECYKQTCISTKESPCGPDKLIKLFEPLTSHFGNKELDVIQHQRVQHVKPDGSLGNKFVPVESKQTMKDVVNLINERMFGNKIHRQPYAQHKLKMLLAGRMRQDLHQNLSENDVVIYSDFSKELELTGQEQCKSEMYGASNLTKQLVGQVCELKVLPPGPPEDLHFDPETQKVSFTKPHNNGGSRIQLYEVHIQLVTTWYLLTTVDVGYLSGEPNIPEKIFGRIGGQFSMRVYSRNLSGLGPYSGISISLNGNLPFNPKIEHELSEDHFTLKNLTWLAEFFFISDHGDMPKTWRSIIKCKQILLAEIRMRFLRDITRCIMVTDTGGENGGSTVSIGISLNRKYINN